MSLTFEEFIKKKRKITPQPDFHKEKWNRKEKIPRHFQRS
jgi:hypothetical protein